MRIPEAHIEGISEGEVLRAIEILHAGDTVVGPTSLVEAVRESSGLPIDATWMDDGIWRLSLRRNGLTWPGSLDALGAWLSARYPQWNRYRELIRQEAGAAPRDKALDLLALADLAATIEDAIEDRMRDGSIHRAGIVVAWRETRRDRHGAA